MRIDKLHPLAVLLLLTSIASAQSTAPRQFGIDKGQTPVMEIGLNYTYFHANAPPAACGCFSMNGGGGVLIVNAPHGLSLVADLSAAHASRVNGTTQNITIFNYLAGLRYSYRSPHRYTPYVQMLAGGAQETSNYLFVQNADAFAASGGGGFNVALDRRVTWNIFEADYVYSRLPNAVNDHQNNLRVSTGVLFRFGPR
jgi:outer membrane immunogenic protein